MSLDRKDSSRKEELQQARRQRINALALAFLLFGIGVITVFAPDRYNLRNLEQGDISPVTYQAERDFEILDREAWRKKKRQTLNQIPLKVTVNQTTRQKNQERFEAWLNSNPDMLGERGRAIARQVAEFMSRYTIVKSPESLEKFSAEQTVRVRKIEQETLKETTFQLNEFREHYLTRAEFVAKFVSLLHDLYGQTNLPDGLKETIRKIFLPSATVHVEDFDREREQALAELERPMLEISRGETLIAQGEEVTARVLWILKTINQQQYWIQISGALSSIVLTILGSLFVYLYLIKFEPELLNETNKIWLMVCLVVMMVLFARALDIWLVDFLPEVEFGIPFASVIMLIALMIGPELAIIVTVFMAFLVSSFFGFPLELLAMYILGGLTGVFSILGVERRAGLIRTGLLVALAQSVTTGLFYVLSTRSLFEPELGISLLWSAGSGVLLVPFIVIGVLPYLENGFGITTDFQLMELVDLNHPLLQELFEKAPGTYHHSIMLSNLCERAARAVGANALLARVGALYHDIGKVDKPKYFIENQSGQKNPHDELQPSLSATILQAHVKEGIQRAEEHNLPPEVIEFISQHHGSSLIKYFYHQARENDESVNPDEFRYPGPRPQTREAGICMIGDAVEAVSRTMDDPTPNKLQEMVRGIIEETFLEGQLNHCDLTVKDLNVIAETFTRVLSGISHQRIKYPDQEESSVQAPAVEQGTDSSDDQSSIWLETPDEPNNT